MHAATASSASARVRPTMAPWPSPGWPAPGNAAGPRGVGASCRRGAPPRPPPPMIRVRIGRSLGLALVGRLAELEVRTRDARPGALRVEFEVALPVSDRLAAPF